MKFLPLHRVRFTWLVLLGLSFLTPARALIIFGGASGHTSDPGSGLPWYNVGNTGVYLGAFNTGYWVITANHVGAGGITLNGNAYNSVSGSAQQIGATDLLLYRIDVSSHGAPALDNLTISSYTPAEGQPVMMVADGSGTMTWGTNQVHQYGFYSLVVGGPQTFGLVTSYSEIAGEAQGQSGDSGGALFYQVATDSWWLSGILSAVGTVDTTQYTFSVALGYYYNDITGIVGTPLNAIPEPGTWGALIGAAGLLVTLAQRRQRAYIRSDPTGGS
jgi:hypothetical protein